jgi:anaerobic selenocysteine-containing dehydrogenase
LRFVLVELRLMAVESTTRRVPGYCALCWSSCGCISVVEDGKLVAVEPDPSHPTGKTLCAKGRAAPELVNHKDRLLQPLKRTRPKGDPDPGWQPIGWDEALDTITAALKRLADESGSESVAFGFTTTAGTAFQDGYPWVERLRHAFGSPNVADSLEVCDYHKEYIHPHTFGVGMPMTDLAHTGCRVCQINLGQAGKTKRESELRCHRHGFPFRHRLVAEYSECATGNEVTVDVEQIVNGTVS